MIEVIGTNGTSEYLAACEIKAAFERTWPGISSSPIEEDNIRVCAGLKLSGYRISDIDVVIVGRLGPRRFVAPKRTFKDQNGNTITSGRIRISTIVATIEVKDQDPQGVQLSAGGVMVRYRDGWSSATEQNVNQCIALRDYLADTGSRDVWVYRTVLLRGLVALPSSRGKQLPESGAVSSGFSGEALLMSMVQVNHVFRDSSGDFVMSSTKVAEADRVLDNRLFQAVRPSRLDRRRMDLLSSRSADVDEIANQLGVKRFHLKGVGGAGKTVLLLQAARAACEGRNVRTLFLTYNHALAADVQRLLHLLGIPAAGQGGGIEVDTVMSFMFGWLRHLGVATGDELGEFEGYEKKCSEALQLIRGGGATRADIAAVKSSEWGRFGYDAIVVDEAQDWPQPEADLLCELYGEEAITIADGTGQLVRGRATNWNGPGVAISGRSVRNLGTCFRMKANLTRFANMVAERAGFPWRAEEHPEARGGRILLAKVGYPGLARLRAGLIERALSEGNSKVDFLHCVAPTSVQLRGNSRVSALGQTLLAEGHDIWDGVDPLVRKDFPRSVDQFRIVQYESCRGLEGWITVLDELDVFWERKRQEHLVAGKFPPMSDPEVQAKQEAWRWVMIALTRPIDTLVVTIRDEDSDCSKVLLGVARTSIDIVERVE